MNLLERSGRDTLRLVSICWLLAFSGIEMATAEEDGQRKNPHMDPGSSPTYAFYWENDTIGGHTDRYYTNGLQVTKEFKTTGKVKNSPFWARKIHRRLEDRAEKNGQLQHICRQSQRG